MKAYFVRTMVWSGVLLLFFYGCSGKTTYRLATDLSQFSSNLKVKYQSIGSHLTVAYLDNNLPDRPVLLLLHGFEAQKEVWLPFARALRGKYRLIIPDLIGDGESSKPLQIDYGIEAQARRLHRFVRKLGLGKMVIIGNSMGGAIATEYASRYPVASLVLMDPLGLEVERSHLEKKGETYFRKVFLHICRAEEYRRLLKTVFYKPPYVPGIVLDYLSREKCRFSRLDVLKSRYLYRDGHWVFTRSLREHACKIRARTLILWGREDEVLSAKNGIAFLRTIPNSRLIFMEDAGHVPMLEKPGKTAQYVKKFLKEKKGKD